MFYGLRKKISYFFLKTADMVYPTPTTDTDYNPNNILRKIVDGRVDKDKVILRTDHTTVVPPVVLNAPVHYLVIPNDSYHTNFVNFWENSSPMTKLKFFDDIIQTAKQTGVANGFNIKINNGATGAIGRQTAAHPHAHVLGDPDGKIQAAFTTLAAQLSKADAAALETNDTFQYLMQTALFPYAQAIRDGLAKTI